MTLSPDSPAEADISIVIPCYNSASTLPALLDSLANQRCSARFEVVLADNGSTDRSREVALSYAPQLPVKVVDASDVRGPAHARNVGASEASAEQLLFIDADDVVAADYVEHMHRALEEGEYVASRVDSYRLNEEWTLRPYGVWLQDGFDDLFGFLPCSGSNCGVRRDLLERVGGWPEPFSATADIAFVWLVQLAGGSLTFVPDTVYFYRHRDTIRGIYRQNRWWGSEAPLLYKSFRGRGMAPRSIAVSLKAWRDLLFDVVRARNKSDWAWVAAMAGQIVGRIRGSIRFRVLYL